MSTTFESIDRELLESVSGGVTQDPVFSPPLTQERIEELTKQLWESGVRLPVLPFVDPKMERKPEDMDPGIINKTWDPSAGSPATIET